jgi:hypothetical protein
VLRLDQLWQQLPTRRQRAIGATLAQMIVQQMAAMHSPPTEKEESDD